MSWKQRFNETQKNKGNERKEIKEEKVKSMSFNNEIIEKYKNLSFFGEIGEGFKLLLKNYHKIILVFGTISIIWTVLGIFLFTELDWISLKEYWDFFTQFGVNLESGPPPLLEELGATDEQINEISVIIQNRFLLDFLKNIYFFFPFVLSGIVMAKYLIYRINNEKISLKSSIIVVFDEDHRKTTFILAIIMSLLISFGISIFFIPGILFLMIYGFTVFFNSEKKFNTINLTRISYAFGNNYRIKTFTLISIGICFYLFFGTYLSQILMTIYSLSPFFPTNSGAGALFTYNLLNPETRDWFYLIFEAISYYGSQALFQPVIYCFLAVQYVEIYIKKEIKWKNNEQELKVELGLGEDVKDTGSSIVNKKLRKKSKKNVANIILSKNKIPQYYCHACGQRIKPKQGQTTVRCENCNVEVHIPKT